MLRVAVLGCGRIGQMHAANLKRHPRTELVAVYDVNRQAAEQLAATQGVRSAASPEEIFSSAAVDAVLIATATPTHADYIELAVAAGKAVLCEKPIDLSLARVNACAAKIKGTKVPIQLGFNRRYDPGHSAARAAVLAGEIGDLHQVILRTASGKQCHINNSRTAVYGYDQRVELMGTTGMVISGNRKPHEVRRFTAQTSEASQPYQFFFSNAMSKPSWQRSMALWIASKKTQRLSQLSKMVAAHSYWRRPPICPCVKGGWSKCLKSMAHRNISDATQHQNILLQNNANYTISYGTSCSKLHGPHKRPPGS